MPGGWLREVTDTLLPIAPDAPEMRPYLRRDELVSSHLFLGVGL